MEQREAQASLLWQMILSWPLCIIRPAFSSIFEVLEGPLGEILKKYVS